MYRLRGDEATADQRFSRAVVHDASVCAIDRGIPEWPPVVGAPRMSAVNVMTSTIVKAVRS